MLTQPDQLLVHLVYGLSLHSILSLLSLGLDHALKHFDALAELPVLLVHAEVLVVLLLLISLKLVYLFSKYLVGFEELCDFSDGIYESLVALAYLFLVAVDSRVHIRLVLGRDSSAALLDYVRKVGNVIIRTPKLSL